MTKANIKALGMAASLLGFYIILEWVAGAP